MTGSAWSASRAASSAATSTSSWRPQHAGDVADLGRHPGRGDDELARPAGDVRVHVDHVGAVAERRVGRRDGARRPCATGRLSPVSADSATSSVAAASSRPSAGTTSPASIATTSPGHELLGRQLRERAVAPHTRLDDHHLRERRDRRRRLALLAEAEHRVEQGQQQDHDPGAGLLDRIDAEITPATSRTICIGSWYWRSERAPARLGLGLGELVRPVRAAALGGLGCSSARAAVRRAEPGSRPRRGSTYQRRRRSVGARGGGLARGHLSHPQRRLRARAAASSVTRVPASPRERAPGVSLDRADRGGPPVCSTNQQAAWTFGPIEPAANSAAASSSGSRGGSRAAPACPSPCRPRRRR